MRSTSHVVSALFAIAIAFTSSAQKIDATTPAPQDVPQAVAGDLGLAGARCPDISRYLNVRSATSPSLSPDGSQLAYSTATTGTPQLWVVDSSGGAPRQITFGEAVTFHDWSPASDWIAYGVDRGGNEREGFYLISPDGRSERELLPPSESFRQWGGWSPDGKRIAFAATAAGSADFDVYTLEVDGGKPPLRVLAGKAGTYVTGWRPDGNGLLLSRVRGEDSNDVLYLDLKSGAVETLFAPQDPSQYGNFAWKPDGSGFYMVSDQGRNFAGVAFYSMAAKKLDWIVSTERDVDSLDLSADGRYLIWSENDGGFSRIQMRDLVEGRTIELPLPAGVVSSIEWAPRAPRAAFSVSAPGVPSDIWTFTAGGKIVRATESSLAGLDAATFIAPEAVSFPSHDGETIYGLMYVPRSASAERRAPVVVSVHGGPTSQSRPRFNAVHQYLLSRGYAVLDLNFRGSTGFGKRFARLDNQRLRPNAVKDMAAAVDWLARSKYPVDAKRAAVMGGSYGGYLTFAALTQLPETFRAGVSFVGVSNWITALEGASPQLKASDRLEYGDIDNPADREFFRELSPLTHVANVRAPLMVLHGANDPRDPVTEADQIVRAIRAKNGDVEYLRFPDEGHGIRKLSNRVIAYRRIAAFLDRTLGGGVTDCAAQAARSDLFEVDLWPGEGRPVIASVGTRLELRESPTVSAKVVSTITVKRAERLQYDETRFRTVTPGRLEALAKSEVTGRRIGAVESLSRDDYYSDRFPDVTLAVDRGQRVDYLQPRAEGTCFVRIGDSVIDADRCPAIRDDFRLESEPLLEWWVRVVRTDGTAGWLLLNDATAAEVDREF